MKKGLLATLALVVVAAAAGGFWKWNRRELDAANACQVNLAHLPMAIEMKAVDHGSFPGSLLHQQRPGDSEVVSFFKDAYRADLVKEGYAKAEQLICPSGGLYSGWMSYSTYAFCTAHGAVVQRRLQPGKLSDGVLEAGGSLYFRGPDWVAAVCDEEFTAAHAGGTIRATWADLASKGRTQLLKNPRRLICGLGSETHQRVTLNLEAHPAADRLLREVERRLAAAPRPPATASGPPAGGAH